MSDITNDFIYGFYLSQVCWLKCYQLRQRINNNIGPIRDLIKVPLLGEV